VTFIFGELAFPIQNQSLTYFPAMYLLTYIGGWFNGLTIIISAWVATFSVPRLYRDNQVGQKSPPKLYIALHVFIIFRKRLMRCFFHSRPNLMN